MVRDEQKQKEEAEGCESQLVMVMAEKKKEEEEEDSGQVWKSINSSQILSHNSSSPEWKDGYIQYSLSSVFYLVQQFHFRR